MKSMLYVGASLMIGASIYGFVDYKQSSRTTSFTTMYDEPQKKEIVTTVKKDDPAPVSKVVSDKKEPVAKAVTRKKNNEAPVVAPVKAGKEEKPVAGKKRKINHRIFSRAPLREEIVEEPVTVGKPDSSVVKIKQQ